MKPPLGTPLSSRNWKRSDSARMLWDETLTPEGRLSLSAIQTEATQAALPRDVGIPASCMYLEFGWSR